MQTTNTPKSVKSGNIKAIDLENALKKIGWSINGQDLNRFIYNERGIETNWRVTSEKVELEHDIGDPIICFYFDGCEIDELSDHSVAIVAKGSKKNVFIIFRKRL